MIEKPVSFNPNNVMFWEPESQELISLKKDGSKQAGTLLNKAHRFLEEGCIQRIGNNQWVCHPIKGYNKTIYRIELNTSFNCNCQGYQSKLRKGEKPICSHIIAVKQFEFMQ